MNASGALATVRGAQLLDPAAADGWWSGTWRYLGPRAPGIVAGERFLLATNLHWCVQLQAQRFKHMLVTMPLMFATSIGTSLLPIGLWWQAGVWVSMFGHEAARVVYHVLRWRADLYVVTNRRVIRTSGLVFRKKTSYLFDRFTHVSVMHQHWWELPLRFGTVRIESGGQHDDGASGEFLRFVPYPDEVADAIYLGMFGAAHVSGY